MTVGIIGLGLIGGSLAKAYTNAGHTVLACDIDESIQEFSILSNAVSGALSNDTLKECDLILIALYPNTAIEFLQKSAGLINKNTTIIDCCGTKKSICEVGFALAEKHGFTFVGGHPMAGKEQSGFKHSSADLFKDTSMIIVPPTSKVNDIEFLDKIKTLLAPAEFKRLTVTTAEKHDEMIAFTSQMAHLVSNAFIKSPTVSAHKGFSAGSYKDLTRVAWLNEQMWTELFMENRKHLLNELGIFIDSLEEYRTALQTEDSAKLQELLRDGKILKEKVDRQ
jgi:prephenate dehydrogenase